MYIPKITQKKNITERNLKKKMAKISKKAKSSFYKTAFSSTVSFFLKLYLNAREKSLFDNSKKKIFPFLLGSIFRHILVKNNSPNLENAIFFYFIIFRIIIIIIWIWSRIFWNMALKECLFYFNFSWLLLIKSIKKIGINILFHR